MMRGRYILLALLLAVVAAAAGRAEEDPAGRFCLVPENWEKIFRKGDITVYSQQVPMSDLLAFRATGTLEAPIVQVMEVLRRVDITGEWMPDIEIKYTVEDRSDFEAITYSINEMPWPFADRELVLLNRLRLDRVRKFLVVDVHSVEHEAIPVAAGNVRADMYCGETLVRPAGAGKTEVDLVLFVDPKGFIPAWLVNLSQKSLPYNFLKALEQKASTTRYTLRPSFQKILSELEAILQK